MEKIFPRTAGVVAHLEVEDNAAAELDVVLFFMEEACEYIVRLHPEGDAQVPGIIIGAATSFDGIGIAAIAGCLWQCMSAA